MQPGPDASAAAGLLSPPAESHELAARIERRLAGAPIYGTLGIHLVHAEPGTVVFELHVTPLHCNVDGILHGGMTAFLADTALGFAARTTASDAATNATVQGQTTYHRPVNVGDTVRAEARVVDRAGRTVFTECTVVNGQAETVARATSVNVLRDPPPPAA